MNDQTSKVENLRKFISEISFTEVEKIKADTLIFQEGIFDSLGFISLLSYLNETYGIEVEEDELVEENFESINAVINFMSNKNCSHQ